VSKFAQTKEDFSMVLSGEAGQGLQTLEQLITKVFKLSGYHVFSYSEFMSRIRGGNNSTQIRISARRVVSYRRRIDIFVPLHKGFAIIDILQPCVSFNRVNTYQWFKNHSYYRDYPTFMGRSCDEKIY
jgi:hypothetical protein